MRVLILSVALSAALLFAPSVGFAEDPPEAMDAIPAGKTTVGRSLDACIGQGNPRADCATHLAARRAHGAALEAGREAAAEAAWEAAAEAAGGPAAGP